MIRIGEIVGLALILVDMSQISARGSLAAVCCLASGPIVPVIYTPGTS